MSKAKESEKLRCKSCGVPEYVGKYHQELLNTDRGVLCKRCRRGMKGVPS
jgi:DNA-directed RNA polymerase subunit RPC12/RpoP